MKTDINFSLKSKSYTLISFITVTSSPVRSDSKRQVGSTNTTKFTYALVVDSHELVETERLHRGLYGNERRFLCRLKGCTHRATEALGL